MINEIMIPDVLPHQQVYKPVFVKWDISRVMLEVVWVFVGNRLRSWDIQD